ncbi:MAG: cell division protein ZapD [Betaproteobacteria bacterium]|nr:cell division protein ZapD [Betaproteobacteria bacterium]
MILYEYPFNERIRTYLRLEHLFLRLAELMGRASPLDHHYALTTIFEVMDVGARADLKSDVLKDRQQDLQRWAATLAPLAESIHLLLKMLRDSGAPQKVMAVGGQFQQNLPQGRTFQLLRLALDPELQVIPEISGNRLMVSIRLMRHDADDRLHACGQDTAFELTLCS